MSQHLVRDIWSAMYWVFFVSMVLPALFLLIEVTNIISWIDSKMPINIGRPWYRFMEWYTELLLNGLGLSNELPATMPNLDKKP